VKLPDATLADLPFAEDPPLDAAPIVHKRKLVRPWKEAHQPASQPKRPSWMNLRAGQHPKLPLRPPGK
jgi:hypothetical protein